MHRLLLLFSAAACCLLPLACDLQQLTADTVMVGTLLSTPEVSISPTAFLGLDGGAPPDGGDLTIPAQTAAFAFIGTREGEDSKPQGLTGATVTLAPTTGEPVTLTPDGSGAYSRSGNGDNSLKYQSGATYRFIAERNGTRYEGQVENAPPQEKLTALHPPEGVVRLSAGQTLTLDRSALSSGQDRTIGFVTVVPLSQNGDRGKPTYTNVPTAPLDLVELVAFPSDWKQARITLPAEAFPAPQQTYLVTFQSVRSGGPESSNLFLGSALLAGTADVGVVRTR
ncbi:hypothetical protein POL68_42320 [Stigmatella sp. ncwal1]|uniref:Lipoprotein n=1 Tax=Stigmatella ashevillensis TaxID=2995309 RepID=A0ABT5DPT8_9BACT|nr:hypothetical protein [Stigmatella ashevillena]MDC0715160.1 hypothetical protein [Stigmatella ashevillena]